MSFREKRQTRHEGSRRASPSHVCSRATQERRRRHHATLRSKDPIQKDRTAEECCVTSFCAEVQRSHHQRCELVGRAQRRSFCLRCTWLVPQASIPAAGGVCTHAMLAHHTALTCMLTSCARRRWKGSGAHIQWISMIGHVVARCSWWWCMPWCNGLLRFAACGDRDRSQDRPLTSRV